jgi:hypothetical protein
MTLKHMPLVLRGAKPFDVCALHTPALLAAANHIDEGAYVKVMSGLEGNSRNTLVGLDLHRRCTGRHIIRRLYMPVIIISVHSPS